MSKLASKIGCLALLVSTGALAQNNPQVGKISTGYGPDSNVPLLIEFSDAQTQPTLIWCLFQLGDGRPDQKDDLAKSFACAGTTPEKINDTTYRVHAYIPKGVASGTYNLTQLRVNVGDASRPYQQNELPPFSVTVADSEHIKFSPIKSIQ